MARSRPQAVRREVEEPAVGAAPASGSAGLARAGLPPGLPPIGSKPNEYSTFVFLDVAVEGATIGGVGGGVALTVSGSLFPCP